MSGWTLRYDDYDPACEGVREALCALGNGAFATRGAGEEAEADDVHYPGTYLAGGYNRLKTEIAGRCVENEDLVNMPNWLWLRFRPVSAVQSSGGWFNLAAVELLSYRQELNVREGFLQRMIRFRDREGRITALHTRRLVHMKHRHLAAIQMHITPENWSGRLEICSALDGRIVNAGVTRYRELRGDHLADVDTGEHVRDGETIIRLVASTSQSHIRIAQAARTRLSQGDRPVEAATREMVREEGFIAQHFTIDVEREAPITIEKIIAIYSSLDPATSEPLLEACDAAARAPGFDELLDSQRTAWRHLWRRCDMVFDSRHEPMELILRLHIFHLLQTVSMHTIDLDFGVPARGLHGEAYRGHIFWDELFILPFLNFRLPELARAMLLYRFRRLPMARENAREQGFRGALYPWQSGSNGREETQQLHLNPRSGRWNPDHSHLQRHVNAAIAYNIWQYVQTTGDWEFLSAFGAEMILEIARFWASAAVLNEELGRYEIHGVVGPDEYHEAYPNKLPGAKRPGAELPGAGLNNNAYTNVMAAWVLARAIDVLELLDLDRRTELTEAMHITDDEIEYWQDISTRMRVVLHDDGVISQFEGYDRLQELDWDRYRKKYGDLHRLDRILEAEGDSANRYKVSKQADVLMLSYLFTDAELSELFARLGCEWNESIARRNIDYYIGRTDHGSTLSRVVHSWVMSRHDPAHSWALFCEALESDISDIQDGTTREGIHLGAMAGTVDLVQRCFTGLSVRENVLWIDPAMPDGLNHLDLRLRFRGAWLRLHVDHECVRVSSDVSAPPESGGAAVTVGFEGRRHRLAPGESFTFEYAAGKV